MKTLVLLFVFFSLGHGIASSKNTIFDVYLDLPNDYLNLTHDNDQPFSKDEKIKAIKVKDIKNGYLQIFVPDITLYTLALFRLKEGGGILLLLLNPANLLRHLEFYRKIRMSGKMLARHIFPPFRIIFF